MGPCQALTDSEMGPPRLEVWEPEAFSPQFSKQPPLAKSQVIIKVTQS